MNLYNTSSFLLLGLLMSGSSCAMQSSDTTISQEVKNLTAFSRMYGYVKYFHPSDEAREIDWDRLAVLGVKRVKEAKTQDELTKALEALFLPIAPTITFSETKPAGNAFLSTYLEQIGGDTTGLKTVAWQHLGVDMSGESQTYSSGRTNRKDAFSDKTLGLIQSISKTHLSGNELKLRATVKAELPEEGSSVELLIRATGGNNQKVLTHHATKSPNTSNKWQTVVVRGELHPEAEHIGVGLRFNGIGRLWMDDVHLEAKSGEGDWKSVPVENASLEKEYSGKPSGWTIVKNGGFDLKVTEEMAFEGSKSFSITSPPKLFKRHPQVGETTVTEIDKGLWSEVPLALFSDEAHTLPRSSRPDFNRLKKELETIDLAGATGRSENVRLADLVVAWNVLQHFYPYFDVVDTDWQAQLRLALRKALVDDTQREFNATLGRMLAATRDGHIRLRHPSINKSRAAGLPFLVDWIEDRVVVTHSLHEQIQPGDIVVSVDGEPATKLVRDQTKRIPGSPQLSLFRSLRRLGAGESGTQTVVEIRRQGNVQTYRVPRSSRHSNSTIEKNHLPVTGRILDGIYYVDLDRAPMSRINEEMDQIASSRGVIFDLRGYPNRNHQVIRHLLTRPDTSGQWLQIPRIVYPDQKNIVSYRKRGWQLKPARPHIRGEVVFITDARAISYAEVFMSFVEHYDLGEIVGQPTAGTNGIVNLTILPGGYRFGWTGMKVVKHDGTRHHLIGIRPTIPAQKTLRGVREGRDELLEKAIQVLQEADS